MTIFSLSIAVGIVITLGALFSTLHSEKSYVYLIVIGSIVVLLISVRALNFYINNEATSAILGLMFVIGFILSILIKNKAIQNYLEQRHR
ncbi:hypothetical protein [Ewingella americana]|uniref:hypothetical protein n=1 Tax=Ewingella americana TaxID=41202 RepID=UPI0012AE8637|nr:hypothetical protein [Ewingella americana]MRT06025.1 hypothetical protein [Ewingella americana]